MPAVVRGLVERRLPQLIVAGGTGDHCVPHASAARRGFPGRCADAWLPAHLRLAGPQLVTERAVFRPVLEQRNGHLNDHAGTSCYASMITVTGSEAGPGGVDPGAGICTGCADSGGRGPEQAPHGSGPGRRRRRPWPSHLPGRAACVPQRQAPRHGGNAQVRSLLLHVSRRLGSGSDTTRSPLIFPTVPCPPRRRGQGLGLADRSVSPMTGHDAEQDVSRRPAASVKRPVAAV